MKILVTGGAGFIGSHVVQRLLEINHAPVVVDNLSHGRLQNLPKGPPFYHLDINDPNLEEVFHREHPQIVIHNAAQENVRRSLEEPLKDAQNNILGMLHLLDLCHRFNVEKLIFSSTGGAIYGEPEYLPCDEAHLVRPLSPYGLSKYVAEQYLELYHHLHHQNYTVLRYSNVFGPRQNPEGGAGVIAIFCRALLEGKQPEIYGTGEQERDFVYVEDVVHANILALNHGDAETYNIGTGEAISVNMLFGKLKEIFSYQWEPTHGPARAEEVFRIRLDSTKAKRDLGWIPQITLEEGLRLTVAYFRSQGKDSR